MFSHSRFAEGIAFVTIGLAKKLLLADPLSGIADPVFGQAGSAPGFVDAWAAASALALGIYFDFSAYSDLAVGVTRMFGMRLPYNFDSPYKASSIIDFWHRWHMTMSRFVRDYVYVPLGGSRHGSRRRYANLMLASLIGGLWHGLGWTFVAWGGLHGLFLVVNHAWRRWVQAAAARGRIRELSPLAARLATLLAVMVTWVIFRAESWSSALSMLQGMAGMNGIVGEYAAHLAEEHLAATGALAWNPKAWLKFVFFTPSGATLLLPAIWALVLIAPNSQEMIDGRLRAQNALYRLLQWRPAVDWAAGLAALMVLLLSLMPEIRTFVYFQF